MAQHLIPVMLCVSSFLLVLFQALASAKPPNIVFILTDDQDVALFGQNPMPKAKELIGDEGMTFNNMFVTSPLCCPSRSSILTGQYVHNHQAYNNSLSGNCSSSAWQQGPEKAAFPVYLKKAGYRTFFAGKYLNQYGDKAVGGVKHIPPGWDDWNGLVGNSVYYNYSLSANGVEEKHGDDYQQDYLTDIIHKKALKFLNKQKNSGDPFFLMLSTPACHAPFDSAPQYLQNFTDKQAPRTKHFNVKGKDKHWLIQQAINPMPNDTIKLIDGYFRSRWRTLLSVDDMIEGVVNQLKTMGQLDNTYIFFTSDNGYHLGQFSLPYDKRQLYDFDIRVPLMVRGPGIKPKSVSEELVMTIDLAPTFLQIANAKGPQDDFDGMSILSLLDPKNLKTLGCQSSEESKSLHVTWEATFAVDPSDLENNEGSKLCPLTFRDSLLWEYYGEHLDEIPACPQFKDQGMNESVMNIDLAPTFLDIARHKVPTDMDGMTFQPLLMTQPHPFRATVLIEHYGERHDKWEGCPRYENQGMANCDVHCVCEDSWNNTYGCVRYETQKESYKYCAMQDNDHFVEVYDMMKDPFELTNIAGTASPDLLTKLSQTLADLGSCAGASCHQKPDPASLHVDVN